MIRNAVALCIALGAVFGVVLLTIKLLPAPEPAAATTAAELPGSTDAADKTHQSNTDMGAVCATLGSLLILQWHMRRRIGTP
jgi:hypothetical protein